MDYSDPKFQALDKECDALRANYNTKKRNTKNCMPLIKQNWKG